MLFHNSKRSLGQASNSRLFFIYLLYKIKILMYDWFKTGAIQYFLKTLHKKKNCETVFYHLTIAVRQFSKRVFTSFSLQQCVLLNSYLIELLRHT